ALDVRRPGCARRADRQEGRDRPGCRRRPDRVRRYRGSDRHAGGGPSPPSRDAVRRRGVTRRRPRDVPARRRDRRAWHRDRDRPRDARMTDTDRTPAFFAFPDLASDALGGAAIACNDEFFAEKENLVRDATPVWKEHEYTDRGKWMDGWETRRR